MGLAREPVVPVEAPVEPEALRRTPNQRAARLLALVLHARQLPYELRREGREWALYVPDAARAAATSEIELYERENKNWPPRSAAFDPLADGTVGVVLYVATILVVFALDHGGWVERWFGESASLAGRVDADRIRAGEWWRVVTSLTLHKDLLHVVGNAVFGGLFFALVCQILGTGLGGAALVVSGALGNLVNALVQDGHLAVGASTAVFGAVGILSAHRWQREALSRADRRKRWTPLMVGVFFLGYLGMSNQEGPRDVDVLAHVFGLAAGLVLGAVLGRYGPTVRRARPNVFVAALAPALVLGAWYLALRG